MLNDNKTKTPVNLSSKGDEEVKYLEKQLRKEAEKVDNLEYWSKIKEKEMKNLQGVIWDLRMEIEDWKNESHTTTQKSEMIPVSDSTSTVNETILNLQAELRDFQRKTEATINFRRNEEINMDKDSRNLLIKNLQSKVQLQWSQIQDLTSSKEHARKAYEKYRKEKEKEIKEVEEEYRRKLSYWNRSSLSIENDGTSNTSGDVSEGEDTYLPNWFS